MAFNTDINRAEVAALINPEWERELFDAIAEDSSVMRLGRRLRDMRTNEMEIRVGDELPVAYFANASGTAASGDTAKLQTTQAAWASKTIKAAKIGVIVPIGRDQLDDIEDYDIWSELRPKIATAFGKVFDAAVIHGTNAPSDWPTNLVAGATAASKVVSLAAKIDIYDATLAEGGTVALVEDSGYMATGHIAAMSIRAKLRGARESTGAPIFVATPGQAMPYTLDGEPLVFSRNGGLDTSAAQMISGDFSQLVYSIRKQLTFELLREASIYDGSGTLQYALGQQDMVGLKCTMRVGWQIPNPPNHLDSTPYPFAVLTA